MPSSPTRIRRVALGRDPCAPRCYSQGESVDELTRNIREAIAGVLEILREEDGMMDSTT